MVLKVIRQDSFIRRTPNGVFISFGKSGFISLSRDLADLLECKEGDDLIFLQDEESPKDFFIKKAKALETGGYKLRGHKNLKHHLGFNKIDLTRKVAKAIGAKTDKAFRIPVAHLPIDDEYSDVYAMFTKNFVQKL